MDEMFQTSPRALTVAGAERVLVAGQGEFEGKEERLVKGIGLRPPVVGMLQRLADELSLAMSEARPAEALS
jgi:LDH2 family malate/lactate/ureidoglycolate dehydrogenase